MTNLTSDPPQYKATHGYVFTSKITDIDNFYGGLYEHLEKESTSEDDRAKTTVFKPSRIGTIILSKSSGAVTIYTNDQNNLKHLKSKIGKQNYQDLLKNLICQSIGIHGPPYQIEINQPINVKVPLTIGEIGIHIVFACERKYPDLHIHFDLSSLGYTLPEKGELEQKASKRQRISDAEIIAFGNVNGLISSKNASSFKIKPKSLLKRLNKLESLGFLTRISKKPAIFVPTKESASVNSPKWRNRDNE